MLPLTFPLLMHLLLALTYMSDGIDRFAIK